MKNYDETVDTVFDRIHTYQIKKKRRTILACRITAACCAVTLLGGSVWYLNRPTHDIPVTIAPDKDEVTTTTVSVPNEEKQLITADIPDNYGVATEDLLSRNQKYISSSLQNKMEEHRDTEAVYAVWVSILMTREDISEFSETDKELAQLTAEQKLAYAEYKKILERDNPSGPQESGKWIHSEEAAVKREIWLSIVKQCDNLRDRLWEQYSMSIVDNRIEKLTALSLAEPTLLSGVDGSSPINTARSTAWKGHAYSAVLTADAINELAEDGGYMFLLASRTDDSGNLPLGFG